MTVAPLYSKTLKRPGTPWMSLTKVASPLQMVSHGILMAQAAAMDAMAFSIWKAMAPLRVTGTSERGIRTECWPCMATIWSSSTNSTRFPCARCVAMMGWWVSRPKKITSPGQLTAMRATSGSVALSTAVPEVATFCTITRLRTAKSSTVEM